MAFIEFSMLSSYFIFQKLRLEAAKYTQQQVRGTVNAFLS
jgi:hypothetical protein